MAKILVIAPHADDETLGLGATMARRASEGHQVTVAVMTGKGEGKHPIYRAEGWDIVRAEARKAHALLGVETVFREIPAVLLPDQPSYQVNSIVKDLIMEVKPDILYVPFLFDMHKDHRELVYACSVAWRPVTEWARAIKEIYMYETLSETHWNIQPQEAPFVPNVWVDISAHLDRKIQALKCYASQMQRFPHTRSIEAIQALATLRGATVGVVAAEAFVLVRKLD